MVFDIGNVVYTAVFAPHLITKVTGQVNKGPTGQLFKGASNQPE